MTAESCGTPTPATTRVVQIEPGPIPILTASAPASTSAFTASAVATLPAMTSTLLESRLMRRHLLDDMDRMAMRGIDHDRIDAGIDQELGAAKPSSPVPVAAATRKRPCSSLAALGWCAAFSMSVTVIRPTHLIIVVDDDQLLDAVLVQQPARLVAVDVLLTVIRFLLVISSRHLLRARWRSGHRGW